MRTQIELSQIQGDGPLGPPPLESVDVPRFGVSHSEAIISCKIMSNQVPMKLRDDDSHTWKQDHCLQGGKHWIEEGIFEIGPYPILLHDKTSWSWY